MSETVDYTFSLNDRRFHIRRTRTGLFDEEVVVRLPKRLAVKMARHILKEYT